MPFSWYRRMLLLSFKRGKETWICNLCKTTFSKGASQVVRRCPWNTFYSIHSSVLIRKSLRNFQSCWLKIAYEPMAKFSPFSRAKKAVWYMAFTTKAYLFLKSILFFFKYNMYSVLFKNSFRITVKDIKFLKLSCNYKGPSFSIPPTKGAFDWEIWI